MDISLQSPRYVSPKTRYEAAKRLPRVEVAKDACYAMHCLCVAIYKRHPQMGNFREHDVIREMKISSRENFQVHGIHIKRS